MSAVCDVGNSPALRTFHLRFIWRASISTEAGVCALLRPDAGQGGQNRGNSRDWPKCARGSACCNEFATLLLIVNCTCQLSCDRYTEHGMRARAGRYGLQSILSVNGQKGAGIEPAAFGGTSWGKCRFRHATYSGTYLS